MLVPPYCLLAMEDPILVSDLSQQPLRSRVVEPLVKILDQQYGDLVKDVGMGYPAEDLSGCDISIIV